MHRQSLADLPSATRQETGWPWTSGNDHGVECALVATAIPKVTIVTPSYNQGQYLEATIRSVLLQGYPNLEYIVIDGGSTDNSIDIIRKYAPWLSFWISEPDQGQADAINKGFEKSSGDLLGWINSDDYLYPGAIWRVVEAFQGDCRAEMIYGDVDMGWSDRNGMTRLLGEKAEFREMLRTLHVPIPQQGCLWRRSVIERIGTLDSRWQVVLDREFFNRAAERCSLRHLSATLGFFRYHEGSKSISQSRLWLSELPSMYEEFFQRSDLQESFRRLKDETMGAVFLTCSSIAFRCGEKVLAIGYMAKALNIDPFVMFRRHIRKKCAKLFRAKLMGAPN